MFTAQSSFVSAFAIGLTGVVGTGAVATGIGWIAMALGIGI